MIKKSLAAGALLVSVGSLAGCSMSGDDSATTAAVSTSASPSGTTTGAPAGDGRSFTNTTVKIGTDVPAGNYTANITSDCTVRVEGGELGDVSAGGSEGNNSGVSLSTDMDGDTTVITMSGSGKVTVGFVSGTTVTPSGGCGTWSAK
jgi:hypothetical protein